MLKSGLLLGCAVCVLAVGAHAQDADLAVGELRQQTVTVNGLRDTALEDATSAITVLTDDDLAVRGSVNPVDQLRAVPGVAVSRSGNAGGLTQVRMRGAEANHTLVLLDGIEISDPTTGETDFGLLTGLGATRIEVLRGEASAIYGSDAIGGVVNLQSGADGGLTGLAEAGTQDTARGQLGYSTGSFGLGVGGFTTSGVDTSGRGGEKDGSSSYGAIARGKADVVAGWEIAGLATYRISSVETDPDLDFDGVLDNADRETDSDQFLIGASLLGQTGVVDHVFRASFNSVERENSADGVETDKTIGERVKAAWSPSIGTGAHVLTGLIEFEQEDYERQGEVSFLGDPNQSRTFETLGVAGEYRFQQDGVDLTASVRHDRNDDRFEDATTWRLGAGYTFDAVNGRLRGSVGEGAKNPTFVELFGFFPGNFVGNPDLEPESSLGWDIGWDQSVGDLAYSLTYFSAELDDEIFTVFAPNFTFSAENRQGSSKREGVEVAGRYAAGPLSVTGQATYTRSEDNLDTDEIRVPELTASLAAGWTLDNGARLGAAIDYVGEQDDFDFGSFPAQRVALDDYALVSATAEWPIAERLAVTLRGENLLDQDAVDVLGFNAPGAGVFIGLKIR